MAGLLPQWVGYNSVFQKGKTKMDIQPKDTSRGHFYVSILKSAVRIAAGASLIMGAFVVTGALLIIAEVLGIVEELV